MPCLGDGSISSDKAAAGTAASQATRNKNRRTKTCSSNISNQCLHTNTHPAGRVVHHARPLIMGEASRRHSVPHTGHSHTKTPHQHPPCRPRSASCTTPHHGRGKQATLCTPHWPLAQKTPTPTPTLQAAEHIMHDPAGITGEASSNTLTSARGVYMRGPTMGKVGTIFFIWGWSAMGKV
eukprot:236979-Chlamydomonas_euryale.AAC.1